MFRLYAPVLMVVFCLGSGAFAVSGSGDSATGPLETVQPVVQSAAALTEQSISVSFSEPMLAPGVTTPANYTLSMPGAGSLAAHPDGVAGSGPFTLHWAAGEMLDGAPVTVTVSGMQDLAGNPVNPAAAAAATTGIGSVPVVSGLSATPEKAGAGEAVEISFTVSETLPAEPTVTVNGNPAFFTGLAKDGDYTYTYIVDIGDPLGPAAVSVTAVDGAGNTGGLSDTAALVIVRATAGMPMRAWPAAPALAAAALLVLVRRRAVRVLPVLLGVLAAASAAVAAGPVVSNVAFVQQSDGAGGTRVVITYDLDSPGGACGVTVSLSKNGGIDGFPHPVTSVSGDVSDVAPGPGRTIHWNIAADYPNEAIPQARIRVTADDAAPVTHTFTYLAGPNGVILGSTPQVVAQGADGSQVVALPNTGHHFVNWSDGSTQNPRKDTNASADITVTASFAVNTYTLTYLAGPNGSISGPTPQTVSHGAGAATVTAVANSGYRFLNWSDGSTQNPRTDTNVTANRTVTANFIQTHTLTYTAGANGSITGASPQTVNHGANGAQVTAAAATGHHFVNWSDGSTQNPRTDTNVVADVTVTANFAPNVYTLAYTAGPNGSITGASPQTVNHGANGATVTAVPETHYHFVDWSDGSTQNPRTDTGVTGDITVTANFAVTFDIKKVADTASNSWVSSFWGHTAPKLAYDGSAYYTVSLSGLYGAATGAVYKYQGGVWTKGYEWTLNYQPPMIMVDATGRLVIVYANAPWSSPTILRSTTPGNINAFTPINASTISWAGYMGAAMHGNKLVLGYINHPDTYSFWVAAVDVSTGVWTAPKMLAQHLPAAPEPQVSWLYPTIVPRADGFHMVVMNNADANNLYNELKYMKLDYSLNYLISPETVDIVPPPYITNFVSHDSMIVGSDNAVYVMGRNINGGVNDTLVHRRDAGTGAWTHTSLAPLGFSSSYTAIFEGPAEPGKLWLTRHAGNRLALYNSTDAGFTWNPLTAGSFTSQGLSINFMHGILQGSSQILPARPAVVFTGSPSQPYSVWFLEWQTN